MTSFFSKPLLLRLSVFAVMAAPLLASCKKDEVDYEAQIREAQAQALATYRADSVTITKYIADSSFTNVQRSPAGVYVVTKTPGTGALAQPGQSLTTLYKGYTLPNTVLFDASPTNSTTGVRTPYSFTLGTGNVIQGWHQGFALMRKGEKAILLIPSYLGYGTQGAGNGIIPPNTPLRFDVELVDVK